MPVSAEGLVQLQKQNQKATFNGRLFFFGVQLDYSCRLKSVSSDGENRVAVWGSPGKPQGGGVFFSASLE